MKKILFSLLGMTLFFNGYSQTFSGGNGSAESPYLIGNFADVEELASIVSAGNNLEGKFLRLEADLDYAKANKFTVIGTNTKKFNGNFDGNNHTVSGLVFDGNSYQGFFGYADKAAVIKNLILESPVFSATGSYGGCVAGRNDGLIDNCHVKNGVMTIVTGGFKGGIAGQSNGIVQNSSFSGSITTLQSAAGVVGQNYGKIFGCSSSATIISQTESSSSTHLGGIAGVTLALGTEPEIADCYFIGTINGGYQNNCGGITGTLRGAEVRRCFTAGYISGSGEGSHCGGIAGSFEEGKVVNCYSASTIYNNTSGYVGGVAGYCSMSGATAIESSLVYGPLFNSPLLKRDGCEFVGISENGEVALTNCYYDSQVLGNMDGKWGKSTRQLTSEMPLDGLSESEWIFVNGLYPRLKIFENVEQSLLYSLPVFLAEGECLSKVCSDFTIGEYPDVENMVSESSLINVNGSNVEVTRGEKLEEITITSYLGESVKRTLIKIYPKMFRGEGTKNDPYIISSVEDFKKFVAATNEQNINFEGEWLNLDADLDFAGTEFTPVASTDPYSGFAGTFDGNNHTINNLSIDNLSERKLNVAMFRQVTKQGVVKNLIIADNAKFKVYRNFAPVVCILHGTVENCCNYASFEAAEGFSGGIAYMVMESGLVKNCFNAGNISIVKDSPNACIGGVVGTNYGTVEYCVNAGNVKADKKGVADAGGIAFSNQGTIRNVENFGLVISDKNVGGIVGSSSGTVHSAISVAPVISVGNYDNVGGIAGEANNGAFVESYYDSQLVVYGGNARNVVPVSTSGLIDSSVKLFEDESAWHRVDGKYPVLSVFADEPIIEFLNVPLLLPADENRTQISSDFVLPDGEGAVWKLEKAIGFKISDGKLMLNDSDSFSDDVLVASKGNFTRRIPISTLGSFLPGKGTEENPYEIASANDLSVLFAEVIKSNNSYVGKYFKVMSDIDMNGVKFAPIAPATVARFEGIVNGNGRVIKSLVITNDDEYSGLFARLGRNASIENLTIDENSVISGISYVGAFAGSCEGKIEGCVSKAEIIASKNYSGGIAGTLPGGSVLRNCKNYGKVSGGGSYVGGITGSSGNGTVDAVFEYNENNGEVSGAGKVGGIVGNVNGSSLRSLVNNGAVTSSSSYTGGVAGYVEGYAKCIELVNTGAVTGTSEVGGLIGYASKSYTTGNAEIESSYNAGNITGNKTNIGGLIGRCEQNIITKCFNTGSIVNIAEKVGSSAAGAGGLVGYGVPEISDSYNAGLVSAFNGAGGIVAYPSSSYTAFSLANVYSAGKVEVTGESSKNVGTIMGKASSKLSLSNVAYDAVVNDVAKAFAGSDDEALSLKTAELVDFDFGSNWVANPNHYPMIKGLDTSDNAVVYSAAVILGDGDTYKSVTKDFNVGIAGGVLWSGDDVFSFEQGLVKVKQGVKGNYSLKVSLNGVEKEMALSVDTSSSGVELNEADGNLVSVLDDGVAISGNCRYHIYGLNGVCLFVGNTGYAGEFIRLENGIYIVKVNNVARKVRIQ